MANGHAARPAAAGKWMEAMVVKPEWGTKRICPSCSARYYDLHRDPIVCPKCGTAFDPEALLKTRRTRAPVVAEEEAVEPMAEEEIDADIETTEDEEAEGEEEEEALPIEGGEEEEEEEEEEELIEDASELGEDEDDMAEVIENVEDEEER
jgi:uncharacterized protein (TIGR02300 family)